MNKVNLAEKFASFSEQWTPKIVGEVNDSYVKLAKLAGEFVWHNHAAEDELFLVTKGSLTLKFRDGSEIVLNAGEFAIVPKGVDHLPVAAEEAHVVLLEPKTTKHTGDTETERTIAISRQEFI